MNGSIHEIKHVVVLMFENRSFDHLFGAYPCKIAPNFDPTRDRTYAVDYDCVSTFSEGSRLDAKHYLMNSKLS